MSPGIKRPGQRRSRAGEKSAGTGETLVGLRSFLAQQSAALPIFAGILLSGILLIPSAARLVRRQRRGADAAPQRAASQDFTDPAMWKPRFLILRLCYTPWRVASPHLRGGAHRQSDRGKSRLHETVVLPFAGILLYFPCSAIC